MGLWRFVVTCLWELRISFVSFVGWRSYPVCSMNSIEIKLLSIKIIINKLAAGPCTDLQITIGQLETAMTSVESIADAHFCRGRRTVQPSAISSDTLQHGRIVSGGWKIENASLLMSSSGYGVELRNNSIKCLKNIWSNDLSGRGQKNPYSSHFQNSGGWCPSYHHLYPAQFGKCRLWSRRLASPPSWRDLAQLCVHAIRATTKCHSIFQFTCGQGELLLPYRTAEAEAWTTGGVAGSRSRQYERHWLPEFFSLRKIFRRFQWPSLPSNPCLCFHL